jgi:hypothetical protein
MRPLPLALLLAFPLAAACIGPDHLEIDPAGPRFTHKGETLHLQGKAMDRAGKVFVRDRPFFRSRDPKIAEVSEHGDLTAVGSGHTVIEARTGSLYAEIPVEVDLVEKLVVSPTRVELTDTSDPIAVTITPVGLDGQPRNERAVEMTTDDPRVARVDPEGKIWGLTPGTTLIKARVDDKLALIEVHVTAAPPAAKVASHKRR